MRNTTLLALLFCFSSCPGWSRGCSSSFAQSFGADWLVVQYNAHGQPMNCWKLPNTSISNEAQSDGIYWESRGHLVHISGWYNLVQIKSGSGYDAAADLLGVELDRCVNGKYKEALPSPMETSPTPILVVPPKE